MAKQETIYTLEDVVDATGSIGDNMDLNPINDFGMTVSDELHSIDYQLARIADALEALVKK
jgi:hypothetical protein